MKKKFLLALFVAMLSVIAFANITASAETYGDLTYTISNGEVTITGCDTSATGEMVIPETIDGYPVTSIGNYAFIGCTGLISITIPSSVTSIGDDAFNRCTGLTRVDIADISAWCKIDFSDTVSNPLYYTENLYLNDKLVTNLVIPDSVTYIGDYAFSGCTGLSSVTIPDSVTSIGYSAFEGCTGLTSITIPDSVTYIGYSAFFKCTGLTRVTIPNSITSIGYNTFSRCTALTSITIPDSVMTIGGYTFSDCKSLTDVTIPDSVTVIGSGSFSDCSGLTSVTIPDSVTSIGDYAFYDCTGLSSVTIPDSVTSIGDYAFSGCTGLSSVYITDLSAWCKINFGGYSSNPLYYAKKLYINGELVTNFVIPDSVTSIGDDAFSGCTMFTSVTIGSGIELIPEMAFYNCSSIKCVAIPTSVKYIRNDAFNGCSKIETVFYEGDQTQWESILKYNRNENLTNAKIIYNASKKTYKFETNCDYALPDIASYAIFTAPAVKNDGATLIGWYDNEELTGEPVAFPYYGDATTLYASWTDRTGTSFDDTFIVKSNREYSVTTTTNGQLVYFEFTPTKSKTYNIYSTGSKDTYGYLYNSKKSQLTSNDDNGDGNNFRISYHLTAGETYYIGAKVYNGTGTFSVFIEEPVEYRINSITLKDFSGNVLTGLPKETFLASVSFTNVSSTEANVIVLASYTESGAFGGLMYVTTKDVPTGSTIEIAIPVDNTNGNIATLKAFCWDSFGTFVPLGKAVEYSL